MPRRLLAFLVAASSWSGLTAQAQPSSDLDRRQDELTIDIRPFANLTLGGAGRATLRAVRIAEPITLDGVVDEMAYQNVAVISDLIQSLPNEGDQATEQTEFWIMFDDDNVYISAGSGGSISREASSLSSTTSNATR